MPFLRLVLIGLVLCGCARLPRAHSSTVQAPHSAVPSRAHTSTQDSPGSSRGFASSSRGSTGPWPHQILGRRALQASGTAFPSSSEPYEPCGVSGNYSVVGFQGALRAANASARTEVTGTLTAYDDCYLAVQNLRCAKGLARRGGLSGAVVGAPG